MFQVIKCCRIGCEENAHGYEVTLQFGSDTCKHCGCSKEHTITYYFCSEEHMVKFLKDTFNDEIKTKRVGDLATRKTYVSDVMVERDNPILKMSKGDIERKYGVYVIDETSQLQPAAWGERQLTVEGTTDAVNRLHRDANKKLRNEITKAYKKEKQEKRRN